MADAGAIDDFVRGFRARVAAMRKPGQELVDRPGIVALLGTSAQALDGRVLVTDDRAFPVLRDRLPDLSARVVNVFAAAGTAHGLLSATGLYRSSSCTAMVHADLAEIPETELADGLRVQPVALSPGSAGVPIEDAALAALRSDPTAGPLDHLDGFVAYLRAAPNARYLAAVDPDGVVRATAAAGIFDGTASVYFVNTDPDWRGRGVGTAMTAAALRVAAQAGARQACLDSSALGLSIYLRLGFVPVSPATLFVRED
ncbi:ribosomal protein S18 acetylase RimI-like enzyme [Marmoricola sp. URHA0025 HA25]